MYPASRRHPHFAGEALAGALEAAGVRYVHLRELGGRRRPDPASPNGGWEHPAFRAYADHMASGEFRLGLARLEEEADRARTAVMCAEGPWWRCHRRLVADALVARGRRVLHVMPDGRTAEHEPPGFAEIHSGEVRYPPPQGRLL